MSFNPLSRITYFWDYAFVKVLKLNRLPLEIGAGPLAVLRIGQWEFGEERQFGLVDSPETQDFLPHLVESPFV